MAWKTGTWLLLCTVWTVFGTTLAAECPAPPSGMCYNADSCSKLDTIKPILNKFTVNFYKKQLVGLSPSENLISSPMNLAVPLGKKCRGASGKARNEIMQAFGIDGEKVTCLDILDVIQFLYRTTPHKSETPDDRDDVTVADTFVFTDKTLKIKEGYECLWQQMFNTTYVSLDIQKSTEVARKEINSVIEDKTKFFKNAVPENGLASTTRFLGLNLFYLQFTWKTKFDPVLTAKASFQNADGSVNQVDMMQFKEKNVLYTKNDKGSLAPGLPDLEVLVLPSLWTTYSLVILLPKAGKDFSVLEGALTADVLDKLLDEVSTAQVTLSMPKFNLDQLADGVTAAGKVGIVTGFQKLADYTPMLGPNGDTILPQQMLQKLTLGINEIGLKATSGTRTAIKTRTMLSGQKVDVRVDRPFLFAIRMEQSGYFAYIGRVVKL